MSLKKDKQKVLGESFSDERIKGFLNTSSYGGLPADYCALEKAYRGMIAENFASFVGFFKEAGRDLNTLNSDGLTFLQVVKTHRNSEEYVNILEQAGAK